MKAPAAFAWLSCMAAAASAQGLPPLALDGAWRIVGLPQQKAPLTQFALQTLDGATVLRVEARGSYGNLVHALADVDRDGVGSARTLAWRWRLEQPLAAADLRTRAGDDAALKVCALFDLPLEALPFWERQKMRVARAAAGEWLPAATLCYVWDPALPEGTLLPNAHSARLRWIVARGQGTAAGRWHDERHDLRADFMRAFGAELPAGAGLPPLRAIAIGADADNTGGRSLGHVAAPALLP